MTTNEPIDKELVEQFARIKRSIFYLKTDIDLPDNTLYSIREKKQTKSDLEQVNNVCNQVLGNIVGIEPQGDLGTFHDIYYVKGMDNEYVFRATMSDMPFRDFHLVIESWIMNELKKRGMPSVDIVKVDLSRKLCQFDYEIMSKAQGVASSSLQNNYNDIISKLGTVVAKLGDISCSGFGPIDVSHLVRNNQVLGLFDSWKDYIFLNLDRHVKTCADIRALGSNEVKEIEKLFDKHLPLLSNISPCLIHGDLSPNNIFTDGQSISAVLDWEDCLVGDPVFDIAFWGTFYMNDSGEKLSNFVNGYKTVKAIPPDFEARYWLYYLRVALAKTVHRYRFKYDENPASSPLSRRIQKGIIKLKQSRV